MHCKIGDLAIAVTADPSKAQNIGTLVQIDSLHSVNPPIWNYTILNQCVCDGRIFPPGSAGRSDDKYLRPLRDTDGDDEMIVIVSKPEYEPAT